VKLYEEIGISNFYLRRPGPCRQDQEAALAPMEEDEEEGARLRVGRRQVNA